MSKYQPLWDYIRQNGSPAFLLSFDDIREITGIGIDHSFLTYKKELTAYGYEVEKISLKEQTVSFRRLD